MNQRLPTLVQLSRVLIKFLNEVEQTLVSNNTVSYYNKNHTKVWQYWRYAATIALLAFLMITVIIIIIILIWMIIFDVVVMTVIIILLIILIHEVVVSLTMRGFIFHKTNTIITTLNTIHSDTKTHKIPFPLKRKEER